MASTFTNTSGFSFPISIIGTLDQSDYSGTVSVSDLSSVTIGTDVTSIEYYAFDNASNLTSVIIGNYITSIGTSAFQYANLTSINIPISVTSIANNAFLGNTNLINVTFSSPSTITTINDNVFFGTGLISFDIPNTVTSIGEKVTLEDNWTNKQFDVSIDQIRKNAQLAWAVVYQKVQGCTEEGTVMLHDLSSRYLKRSHLYVGLSRVTDGSNVFIARD